MTLQPVHTACLGMTAALILTLTACLSPPHIVGPLHPPISPSAVVVYRPRLLPRHYTVIAKLDATGYGGCSSRGVDRIMVAELRKQAARLGANGILLVPDRHFHIFVFRKASCIPSPPVAAEAIYVPRAMCRAASALFR